MERFLKTRGIDLAVVVFALTALMPGPAWAGQQVPAPAAGILAGGAIIGAIVIAKWWRQK